MPTLGAAALAADTPENLQRLMSSNCQVIAEIAAPAEELRNCWAQLPEVGSFDISPAEGEYFRCALTPRDGIDLREYLGNIEKQLIRTDTPGCGGFFMVIEPSPWF